MTGFGGWSALAAARRGESNSEVPWPLAASLVAANGTLADLDVLPDLTGAFAESQPGRNDPAALLNLIGAVVDRPLSGGSLLFLDEIQAAPHALASLRYFLEELPERPVVAAGSLMEFALAEHSFPMPVGRIEYLHIGPMTFTEFLKGIGKEGLAEAIETFAWGGEGAPPRPHPLVHGRLLEALRLYRFIGGMPEAVSTYAESGDLRAVSAVQAGIIETYRDDFPSRHPEVPASVRCRKASALGRPLRRQPTSAANGAGGGAAARRRQAGTLPTAVPAALSGGAAAADLSQFASPNMRARFAIESKRKKAEQRERAL